MQTNPVTVSISTSIKELSLGFPDVSFMFIGGSERYLQLEDALFDGSPNHKAGHVDWLVLPKPMDPILSLQAKTNTVSGGLH